LYTRRKVYDLSYFTFIGTWAWILNRLSGLALIFYLCLHIWVINNLTQGAEQFNRVMLFLNQPLFKILEAGLWGVILYHAFNGVRIIIVDFFKGTLAHKRWFVFFIGLAFFLWALGSYLILSHIGG